MNEQNKTFDSNVWGHVYYKPVSFPSLKNLNAKIFMKEYSQKLSIQHVFY